MNYNIFIIFTCSLVSSILFIKGLIRLSKEKFLYDKPIEERKIHIHNTPNLGGVGIFLSILFTISLLCPPFKNYNFIFAASVIIISFGVFDDLVGLSANTKFIAQILAAFIISYFGNIRIQNFNGFLGLYELAFPLSMLLSIFVSVFLYNCFNLIDGINGLAGTLGFTASIFYSFLLFSANKIFDMYLAIAIAGSLLGFLYFNINKAKIFMGDTGSLFLGVIFSVFSIQLMNGYMSSNFVKTPIALSLIILIIPIFDTCRVILLRLLNGTSPFKADDNHIHHRLFKIGFTHLQINIILSVINLSLIMLNFYLQNLGEAQLIIFDIISIILINIYLWSLSRQPKIMGIIKKMNKNDLELNEKRKNE